MTQCVDGKMCWNNGQSIIVAYSRDPLMISMGVHKALNTIMMQVLHAD